MTHACVAPAVLATMVLALPVQQPVELSFSADAGFDAALAEYSEIWDAEGGRIGDTLERISGMQFPVSAVRVQVIDGPSWAGRSSMGMRATYPVATKRATLAHELGHILIGDRIPDDAELDHHYVLFLFLYDTWVELWGAEFAVEQVAVESQRRGGVDYEGIWKLVLEKTEQQRANELETLIAEWAPEN
ncbi:MAG: hypothetical protein GKS06_05900 [Acidobacteria bacterium]|nr:hypothetical protein [Acidobacteriota bacterium]